MPGGRPIQTRRTFSGRVFRWDRRFKTKREAIARVKTLRRNGYLTRGPYKMSDGYWHVWSRRAKRRVSW